MPTLFVTRTWRLLVSIPMLTGEGLVLEFIDLHGTRVLYRAGQPIALVPYHDNDPSPPYSPTFKEGLGPLCGGAPYTPVIPTSPNVPEGELQPRHFATNDGVFDARRNPRGALAFELARRTPTESETLVLWAKFQVDNYQYIHRWLFHEDGSIDAQVGLGGKLHDDLGPDGVPGGRGHVHNFYFRLDFDIVTSAGNQAQRFRHKGWGLRDDDPWEPIRIERKDTIDLKEFTKWRVIEKALTTRDVPRSYELIPCSEGAADGTYCTGDAWIVRYKGLSEDGWDVGPPSVQPPPPGPGLPRRRFCNDDVLGTKYVNGESVDGEDVVVWYCLRTHHLPRHLSEEKKVVPYEFLGFHMQPRDFLSDTPREIYATDPPSPLP